MATLIHRREILGGLLAGCAALALPGGRMIRPAHAQTPVALKVHRDEGCGCCHVWAEQLSATGRFAVELIDEPDMQWIKQRLGVSAALASCHTAECEGLVFEGHVPAEDMLRLLQERPAGIYGLAVPGMPTGSPGMEHPRGLREAFDVIAMHSDGSTSIFASYPASNG